jgi:predicted enzyme related to lactoylglutathione lyase
MDRRQALLHRLDEIGQSLAHTGEALALLGLGSAGLELDRLDAYSDLDFFAIAKPGRKAAFLADLGWLSSIQPIAYRFQNTPDGCKLLFEDGIFCEFAVFEESELAAAVFAPGRVIWKTEDFDEALLTPKPAVPPPARSIEWAVGEAVTCLYVGLCRYRRGEKLSAARFVQHYAVDRIVELAPTLEAEQPAFRDPFALERRFEARFQGLAREMPQFVQGYERTPESARAILQFLAARFDVNPAMQRVILALCDEQGDLPTPLFEKIDCVRLHVPDLAAGLVFYQDRLGQRLLWRTDDAAGLHMPGTDAEIVLHADEPLAPEIDLLVASADAAVTRFAAAGGNVVVPPFDIRIGRAAVVADPWGNQIVLLDMSHGPIT